MNFVSKRNGAYFSRYSMDYVDVRSPAADDASWINGLLN